MLTGDENIVRLSVAVQYRIDDPRHFLFSTVSPVATLSQATSSAVRQIIGGMKLDNILTVGRQKLADNVDVELKHIMQKYNTGIEIRDVAFNVLAPPNEVTEAFNDAVKARENKQQYILQADKGCDFDFLRAESLQMG